MCSRGMTRAQGSRQPSHTIAVGSFSKVLISSFECGVEQDSKSFPQFLSLVAQYVTQEQASFVKHRIPGVVSYSDANVAEETPSSREGWNSSFGD